MTTLELFTAICQACPDVPAEKDADGKAIQRTLPKHPITGRDRLQALNLEAAGLISTTGGGGKTYCRPKKLGYVVFDALINEED